jgi:hypothetical protein
VAFTVKLFRPVINFLQMQATVFVTVGHFNPLSNICWQGFEPSLTVESHSWLHSGRFNLSMKVLDKGGGYPQCRSPSLMKNTLAYLLQGIDYNIPKALLYRP